jgi:DNA-binding response OmpR family regulator
MKKILICEDDKFLSNAYKVKFTKRGYEVRQAYDGVETVKALSEYSPDIIILDLIMPVKDGFSVLEDISKNDTWKKIPCIVASNLGQPEDLHRAQALGAKEYVIKTDLSIDRLVNKVENLLTN